jgi:hypothetical protein
MAFGIIISWFFIIVACMGHVTPTPFLNMIKLSFPEGEIVCKVHDRCWFKKKTAIVPGPECEPMAAPIVLM